ncbi:B12-binding domain-containing radical SAM protein [Dolichospermum circinale]|uniref:B12-binding domain-containing radical SAM protein n=1 Tax=Dolichospermum circinale CS-537/01 TaxID=3021739 RepID=A0ABT5A5B9_9CYAN|nr:B12-binding domain-containing radical SAM protein [Dolichospermum circinale]MDB9453029.1 B12-binding domain-containing radical SAM protein [Dolichospermum circinale CS-541/06]MDB9464915.1 B12-binding domain-containing radical SAM protein [Dolichospermum circinale CS-541/04]MDB9465867.1 B12-binding domain-containing radical SAM protein [Dolichospermum circinale CS-539/09]MDB9470631.1 B12-binding domain-containing radical SAM protein [Dolichospermum circinale CS-539]MDB9476399.1 B12-binding d
MNVLLIYPLFPKSFWSFEKTLALLDRKAMLPPLGLVTVAAILPQEWNFKLVDRNIRQITAAEWAWADLVILSAMIVQKEDLLAQIQEAKGRGKRVAVGGPYPTALPQEVTDVGADYLILDEGEITLPLFIDAISRGETSGIFRSGGEKPDVTNTPIPRFDLLEFDAYAEMSVQFSRGCPFQCEFCDIIVLYGRKPRTKSPAQLLAELDYLYELGWRRSIFMVDDNFIGNKRNVKLFLKELQPWMVAHEYPFSFATEASVDLAQDQELMDAMVRCNFGSVFLGIETPDEESLAFTQKFQNTRDSLSEAVYKITRSGLRVMAGFIIGFDGEKSGAGARIVKFVEQTSIPTALFSMLQALPDTALWHRLAKENRLRSKSANINQTTLMNFVPTRPLAEIASEYVEAFWELYEPSRFLDRAYRHYRILGEATYPKKGKGAKKPLNWKVLRALLTICWRQGVLRNTRWQFWRNLWSMYKHNPGGISSYLSVCAQIEHFLEYRQIVRDEIEAQVAEFLEAEAQVKLEEEKAQVLV